MIKFPEVNLADEAEMRAFYASCGVSSATTEAAIKVRHKPPQKEKKPSALKGRKRKGT